MKRSEHPMFSFAALGPKSEIVENCGKSAFGYDSIHERLRKKKCCFLNIGRSLESGNTLVHNVETLYWIRKLLENHQDSSKSDTKSLSANLRAYSISGRVREPGVKIAPIGITARDLINNYAGGMAEGHNFKAYLPGGASGGILPASLADIPMDFGTLEKYGCFVGSAAVIVLSD